MRLFVFLSSLNGKRTSQRSHRLGWRGSRPKRLSFNPNPTLPFSIQTTISFQFQIWWSWSYNFNPIKSLTQSTLIKYEKSLSGCCCCHFIFLLSYLDLFSSQEFQFQLNKFVAIVSFAHEKLCKKEKQTERRCLFYAPLGVDFDWMSHNFCHVKTNF